MMAGPITPRGRRKRNFFAEKRVIYHGEEMTISELSTRSRTSIHLLYNRMSRGWTVEDAADTPNGQRPFQAKSRVTKVNGSTFCCYHGDDLTIGELSEITGTPEHLLADRLASRWSVEDAAEMPDWVTLEQIKEWHSRRVTLPASRDPSVSRIVDAFPDGLSQDQIGIVFGLTRERVSQIEVSALSKLARAVGGRHAEIARAGEAPRARQARTADSRGCARTGGRSRGTARHAVT